MEMFLFDPEGFFTRMLVFLGALLALHFALLSVARLIFRDGFLAGVFAAGAEFVVSVLLFSRSAEQGAAVLGGFAAGSLAAELHRYLERLGKF
ncbi:hypothetical protein [Desulfofundulus thermosubterraneus]|uniref:Uncharacterized protein n=1 Tax=Desulfofundulus thermosubterraneus DSM 16057 TaxID=1121432 RepID=A0A1M6JAI0_9FIRM|nr:hypothetical protein [Desulfofundulus thermosubterraneus]SHJ43662.1 hypothetical protein SAMN02745219_02556 [Desulfofundulus thermosubterraneus DSM 16057]